MPTIEVKIWLALRSRVESLPVDLPIAWPAEIFEPPYTEETLGAYLRVGRISTDPVPMMIPYGKGNDRTGSLIITLVHPLSRDYTVSRYDQLAGEIANHFKDGTNIRYLDICLTVPRYPTVQEGYEDNGYWAVPVVIPWRTFA